jgi:hypothetical protein
VFTLGLQPGETRFKDGRLKHEDNGTMGQFVVLGEGERVGVVPRKHHG